MKPGDEFYILFAQEPLHVRIVAVNENTVYWRQKHWFAPNQQIESRMDFDSRPQIAINAAKEK